MRKNILQCGVLLSAAALLLTSCAGPTYDGFEVPEQGGSTLKPVAEYTRALELEDAAPEAPTISEVSSKDGICRIEKKEQYYNVTLDLKKGGHRAAGAAYAEAILAIYPDFPAAIEPYIYENINMAFSQKNEKTYDALAKRVTYLKDSLEEDYKQEIEGFAENISGGKHGFTPDGVISYEEALTVQMVPDALRGTNCSAASLDGSRTVSGERLTARILEWITGSSDQLSQVQAVLRLENGDRSMTSVSALGLMDVITGFNDSGVLVGCLDVGASDTPYTYEGKTCYSFTLRHVLEEFDTAREAGEYLVAHARSFTYSNNILVSDRNEVFCAEDSSAEELGEPLLRTPETPLRPDYTMTADGAFFIVNCYISEGRTDPNALAIENLARWRKFNEWFSGDEKFSAGSFKSRLACETEECYDHALRPVGANADAFHVLVIDYATGDVQVTFFRPDDSAGIPDYIRIAQISS